MFFGLRDDFVRSSVAACFWFFVFFVSVSINFQSFFSKPQKASRFSLFGRLGSSAALLPLAPFLLPPPLLFLRVGVYTPFFLFSLTWCQLALIYQVVLVLY